MGKHPFGHSWSMAPKAATQHAQPDPLAGGAERPAAAAAARPAPAALLELTPRRLYDSHFSFVWRNLRRLGLPDPLLEDAAQDVFLVVHRRWESYDAKWSSVETWLFGILLRVARNHRRSLRRRGAVITRSSGDGPEMFPSVDDGPADLVARREAAALLDRLLDTLDDDKRAILVLVDVEQLTVPQAAEALAINLNTAYWRLRAARKMFERSLARVKATEMRTTRERDPGERKQ
jgi:RNA polymerase sigma-70 factor, ECF subfamily